MSYEVLLDDLLANLSKKGIDVSKLKITEEQQSVENILNDFISPSRNTTARTVQIVENKKAVKIILYIAMSFFKMKTQ